MPDVFLTEEEYNKHDCTLKSKGSCRTCEVWFEQEFDRLYEIGQVAEGVLDDDLSDFKDSWVAEELEGKRLQNE